MDHQAVCAIECVVKTHIRACEHRVMAQKYGTVVALRMGHGVDRGGVQMRHRSDHQVMVAADCAAEGHAAGGQGGRCPQTDRSAVALCKACGVDRAVVQGGVSHHVEAVGAADRAAQGHVAGGQGGRSP